MNLTVLQTKAHQAKMGGSQLDRWDEERLWLDRTQVHNQVSEVLCPFKGSRHFPIKNDVYPNVVLMLASILGGGPALKHHWVNVSCLLGCHIKITCTPVKTMQHFSLGSCCINLYHKNNDLIKICFCTGSLAILIIVINPEKRYSSQRE